jgi:hypothetical protein
MSVRISALKTARLIHLYLGAFIAPAILFFAFTGVLQTFSLHDTAKNGSYKPAHWIVVLAQLHKKQTIQVTDRKPQAPDATTAGESTVSKRHAAPPPGTAAPTHNALPMKIFFLIVGIGLFVSTMTGLYMSFTYVRSKWLLGVSVLAGIVIPVLLAIT